MNFPSSAELKQRVVQIEEMRKHMVELSDISIDFFQVAHDLMHARRKLEMLLDTALWLEKRNLNNTPKG